MPSSVDFTIPLRCYKTKTKGRVTPVARVGIHNNNDARPCDILKPVKTSFQQEEMRPSLNRTTASTLSITMRLSNTTVVAAKRKDRRKAKEKRLENKGNTYVENLT